jgi:hypothetical protein
MALLGWHFFAINMPLIPHTAAAFRLPGNSHEKNTLLSDLFNQSSERKSFCRPTHFLHKVCNHSELPNTAFNPLSLQERKKR